MKNQYLKLTAVLLITFPSLLGCRVAKQLIKIGPEVIEPASDAVRQGGRALKTLDQSQVSQLKKSIRQAASFNITQEAINNGNKISKQKVEKHIADEIEREMKRMKRTLNRTQKQQIEEEVEEEVEKDLEENGITVTGY
ncbi:hypothetical protein [Okeania sp. KiyG1]|uniref:hypothetical protein n=1 Tax=Okeania sp. KiyG1 TaxID=2720165 RepID=UPI001921EEAB|nr:hypothetical protein [Okeania sp. KiyG1]GGA37744.1 hypothetical protein CYANOKiyG1_55820 [Okeania sp. KiyG1]